jgi:recombination protein RecA
MGEEKAKQSFADKLRKKYGENAIKSIFDDDPLEIVSSGILSLDYVSGVGGFAKGMNHVIEGMPSSGKTEIVLDWCKYFLDLNPNHKVYFIDVENRLRKDRLLSRGISEIHYAGRFEIGRCGIAEKVFDIMCDVIESKEFDAIIVDSIAMLTPKADFEKAVEDQTKPGTQGKALNQGFRKLCATMIECNSKCINIFINQVMANIGAMQWQPKTVAKSGLAPKFMSSFTIEVEKLVGRERVHKTPTGEQIGNDIKLICRKNSLGRFQERKATFHLNYETGPVLAYDVMNLGLGFGLIKQDTKISYSIKDKDKTHVVRGYDNVVQFLKDNPDTTKYLQGVILEKIKQGVMTEDIDDLLEEGE